MQALRWDLQLAFLQVSRESRKRGEASGAGSPPRTDLCPRGPALTLPHRAQGGAAASEPCVCRAGQAPGARAPGGCSPLLLRSCPGAPPAILALQRPQGRPRPRSNLAKVNIFSQELSYRTVDEDTRLLGSHRADERGWGRAGARGRRSPPATPICATAAFSHGQPLEPVVRLLCPLSRGDAGAAAGRCGPRPAAVLPPAPRGSGPAQGSHGDARSEPEAGWWPGSCRHDVERPGAQLHLP